MRIQVASEADRALILSNVPNFIRDGEAGDEDRRPRMAARIANSSLSHKAMVVYMVIEDQKVYGLASFYKPLYWHNLVYYGTIYVDEFVTTGTVKGAGRMLMEQLLWDANVGRFELHLIAHRKARKFYEHMGLGYDRPHPPPKKESCPMYYHPPNQALYPPPAMSEARTSRQQSNLIGVSPAYSHCTAGAVPKPA